LCIFIIFLFEKINASLEIFSCDTNWGKLFAIWMVTIPVEVAICPLGMGTGLGPGFPPRTYMGLHQIYSPHFWLIYIYAAH
jgi:hypothetical protein